MRTSPTPAEVGDAAAHLDARECWTLLRTADVGRLALVVDDCPEIFPVNFVVDHGTLLFRTAAGSKLAALPVGIFMNRFALTTFNQ
jgi:nitroimidazol reductase NimA-like FMN-containing flavoprotein (pyridoxamine 5'-phosphate oxidase superfamily)